jgi:hypothetical protein
LCVLTTPPHGLDGWNFGTNPNVFGDADSGLACAAKAAAGNTITASIPMAMHEMVLLISPTPNRSLHETTL